MPGSDVADVTDVPPGRRRVGRPSGREAERKHEAMLEAALQEFSCHGFLGASVRAIAERACLSTRTLYNRYPDKLALFAACLEMSALRDNLPLRSMAGSLHEQLASLARHMLTRLNHERTVRLARIIYRECTSFPQLEAVSRRQFERFQLEPIQGILEAHGFALGAVHEFAAIYVGMIVHPWQSRVIYGERPMTLAQIKAHVERTTSVFLRGAVVVAGGGPGEEPGASTG